MLLRSVFGGYPRQQSVFLVRCFHTYYEHVSSLSAKTQALVKETSSLQAQLLKLAQANPSLWPVVHEKLFLQWTYHSNRIEGSTLTYGDTHFLLKYGITVSKKSFADYLAAKNHHHVIESLQTMIIEKQPITTSLIRGMHAVLMEGQPPGLAITPDGKKVEKKITPGHYKTLPNHVLRPDGAIHYYVNPEDVSPQMSDLFDWINAGLSDDRRQGLPIAAIAHYNFVRIHPFDDGNGRCARILMNLILLHRQLQPIVVRSDKRFSYIDALERADQGDMEPFITVLGEEMVSTYQMLLKDMEGRPALGA